MPCRRFLSRLLLAAALTPCATADVLTVRSKEHPGRFVGFEDGQFLFLSEIGEATKYARTVVESLALDAPCEVRMVRASKTAPESALLHGYKQSKFTVELNGTRLDVPGMQVKRMEVGLAAPAGPFGAGGAASADVPGPRPPADVSSLEKAGDLTPAQKGALDRYRRVRQEYEAFIAKSTALVAEMEKATGARRESLLDALRQRKNEEQPLVRRLESAEAALLAVLPRGGAGGANAAARNAGAAAGPAAGHAQRSGPLPAVAEGQVVLLDLGDLERLPNLNHDQSAALRQYSAAKGQYLKTESAADAAQPGDLDAAARRLRDAQAAVLKAFPGLKFE